MTGGHGPAESGGSTGSNSISGAIISAPFEELGGAAHNMTGMFNFLMNGLLTSGRGGVHDHGHH